MYSRRPTSMPTWASAGRTVQRGCEPRAINPLQREKSERGRFLVARDIGTKRDLFNKALTCLRPMGAIFASRSRGILGKLRISLAAHSRCRPGCQRIVKIPLPVCQNSVAFED